MPRRFGKSWRKNLALVSLIFLLPITAFADQTPPAPTPTPAPTAAPTPAPGPTPTPEQAAATNLNSTIQGAYGSNDGMRTNMTSPVLDSGTPLYTLDRTQQGDVSLPSQATKAFLTLTVVPSATGDFQPVLVTQDLDLDGVNDNVVSFGPVSGICANGIIQCTPGTFSGCKYWQWDAPNGKIAMKAVNQTDLAGCYCINNSCGANIAVMNLSILVSDLGGGAVASVLRWNPRYAISNVQSTDGTISYYGRMMAQTTAIPGVTAAATTNQANIIPMSGSMDPVQFQDPGVVSSAGDAELQKQATDPNSYYSILKNTQAIKDSSVANSSCTMTREMVANYKHNFCHDPAPASDLKEMQIFNFYKMQISEGWWQTDGWVCNMPNVDWGAQIYWNSVVACAPDTKPLPTGGPFNLTAEAQPNMDFLGVWVDLSIYVNPGYTGSWKWTYGTTYNYYSQCNRFYDDLSEWQVDSVPSCASLDQDPKCNMVAENIDGVTTWVDGHKTGLQPQPSCQTLIGTLGSYQECRDWFKIGRTYSCKTNQTYDFAGTLQRYQTVSSSTALDQSTGWNMATYNDSRLQSDGTWLNDTQAVNLGKVTQYSSCDTICKVRKTTQDTQAGIAGTASQFRGNVTTYVYSYKSCLPDCKLDPGEELITDCGCLNTFADGLGALETLDHAKDDTICASKAPVSN